MLLPYAVSVVFIPLNLTTEFLHALFVLADSVLVLFDCIAALVVHFDKKLDTLAEIKPISWDSGFLVHHLGELVDDVLVELWADLLGHVLTIAIRELNPYG